MKTSEVDSRPSDDEGYGSPSTNRSRVVSDDEKQSLRLADQNDENFEKTTGKPNLSDLRRTTLKIVSDVIADELKITSADTSDPVTATLLQCCKEMRNQDEGAFQSIVSTNAVLDDWCSVFTRVSDQLFEGNESDITWPRIIAMFCFVRGLVTHYKENGSLNDNGEALTTHVTTYIIQKLSTFLLREGGWEGLADRFPVPEKGSTSTWSVLKWGAVGVCLMTASQLFPH